VKLLGILVNFELEMRLSQIFYFKDSNPALIVQDVPLMLALHL